ncbi:MAG: prolyl oligopeptidase family serine peptidase [Ilumatobacteraceae bacterium]
MDTFERVRAISAERCIGGRDLTEPRLSPDGTMLVYAKSTAGGAALMLSNLDGSTPRQLTAYPHPRPGRGLGGGCWCWTPDSEAVVYCGADGNLWLQPVPGGQVRRLTEHGPDRTAQGPMVTPTSDGVVYVLDQADVWFQSFDGSSPRRLDDGAADFCFDPYVTPCGTAVVWQAWNIPDMAWDSARVQRITFDGTVNDSFRPNGALQQPRATPDGVALCVRDDTGWNNVWLGDEPLIDEPFEHADPTWGFGQRSFAMSPDGTHVAFARNEGGFGRLCVADVATRTVREIARGVHGQLSWHGDSLAAMRTGAKTPTQIVIYDASVVDRDTWPRSTVDVGPVSGWESEPLAEPEPVEVTARDGATLFARLFRADEPTDRLLCWLHGGPTDQWQVAFMPRIAYWRSRGWNVLVPDHRGSTGHGRAYQQAMNGRWGDLDVSDTIDFVEHAQRNGWGHPTRTAMMGGSAGGFTVLGLLAEAPDLAGAAVVSYPVTDLIDMAERSHRFERHYTHHLVAPLPASANDLATYVDRSPVTFASRIRTPLLVLHGDADAVVPIEQSRNLATRIVEAGGLVELCVYEGEGHGFRQPLNQLDEYRRIGAFLQEYVPNS